MYHTEHARLAQYVQLPHSLGDKSDKEGIFDKSVIGTF